MFVKEEMCQFLETYMANFESKNRELILYHYGFQDGICHILDETGEKFSSQDTKNKRARPQQIINDEFKPRAKEVSLISLHKCLELLLNSEFWISTAYASLLQKNNLVSDIENANVVGIITLIEQLDLCNEYSIYSSELKKLGSKTVRSHEVFFLVRNSIVPNLWNGIKMVNSEGGLTSFSRLRRLLGANFIYKEHILELIRSSNRYICVPDEDNDEIYFYVRRKNNTFQKSFTKIYGALKGLGITAVPINELSEVLHNSLGRRSIDDTGEADIFSDQNTESVDRPPVQVIRQFIEKYDQTIVKDALVTYHGEIQNKFDDFDNYIVELLAEKGEIEHGDVIEFLLSKKRYSSKGLSSRFIYSPLVRVNRAMGRGQHTYSLIGTPRIDIKPEETVVEAYSYDDLMNSLQERHVVGTNGEAFVNIYLDQRKKASEIKDFTWVSQDKANSDHDFRVTELDDSVTYVDVKATKNNLGDRIYISRYELEKIAKEGNHYYIYRVFKMQDDKAFLRIISNSHELATEILEVFQLNDKLHDVFPESISLPPTLLEFGEEISISK
jgi:hypothetical protein